MFGCGPNTAVAATALEGGSKKWQHARQFDAEVTPWGWEEDRAL